MRLVAILICVVTVYSHPCMAQDAKDQGSDQDHVTANAAVTDPTTNTVSEDTAHENAADEASDILAPYRDAAIKKWKKAIDAFDTQNAQETDPADGILFIGSSSIRRWDSMPVDMMPYRTIRRGYGGAKFTDMAMFVDRLIQPHQYRAMVMFIGNGVTGKPEDHTPDLIETLARKIVASSHHHQSDAPVFLIEITPCGKRFDVWHKIRAVNARLREIALSTPNTYFIPTASYYLRPDGAPRSELFVEDQLHLSDEGYRLWSSLIRKRLDDVFRLMAVTQAAEAQANEESDSDSPSEEN